LEIRLTSSDLLRSFGHLGDCLDNPANIFNSGTIKIFFLRFASVNISRNSSTEYPFHLVIGREKSVSDDRDSHNEAVKNIKNEDYEEALISLIAMSGDEATKWNGYQL
jgi:hypothetical protein